MHLDRPLGATAVARSILRPALLAQLQRHRLIIQATLLVLLFCRICKNVLIGSVDIYHNIYDLATPSFEFFLVRIRYTFIIC